MRRLIFLTMLLVALMSGTARAAWMDNHDGTVSDTETCLMWQQASAPGTYTWQQALAYAESLSLPQGAAAHNDWRLPNRNELQTLVNYSRYNPSIDTTFFPDTVSSVYWSSTTYALNTYGAWVVYFYDGYVYSYNKVGSYYVRAVRGGQCRPLDHSVISAAPQALDFGAATLGAATSTRLLTITNTGTAVLDVASVTIGGAAVGDFNKVSDTCTNRSTLPQGTCTVGLAFRPTATGNRAAVLTVAANAANAPLAITLAGTGGEPAASNQGSVLVRVYDSSSGTGLQGATIRLGSQQQESGADGRAMFSTVDAGPYALSVQAAGYAATTRQVTAAARFSLAVPLGLTPLPMATGKPVVTDIFSTVFDRNQKAYFLHGVPFSLRVSASVDWQGKTPGYVRFSTPRLDKNEASGSHLFDMGADFGPGGRLLVTAVAADGTMSQPLDAHIEVMPLPPGTGDGDFTPVLKNQDYAYAFSMEVGIALPVAEKSHPVPEAIPFFKGQEFSFTAWAEGEVELQRDGTARTRISHISEDAFKLGKVGFDTALGGEIVMRYEEDRNAWRLDGGYITSALSTEIGFGPYYQVVLVLGAPVPVYLRGELAGGLDGRLGVSGFADNRPLLNGELEPTIEGTAFAGVGVAKILNGEVYLGVEGSILLGFPGPPVWKESEVSVEGGFVGTFLIFSRKVPLWELTKRWPEEVGTRALRLPLSTGDYSGWQPIPRNYGGYGQRQTMAISAAAAGEEGVIPGQNDIFPRSEPVLTALADNRVLLTWVADDLSKADNNRTTLYSSVFANDQWSTPLAVHEDGTGDFSPALAPMTGGAVLAWQDSAQVYGDTATVEELLAGQEISVARYGDGWQGAQRLTANSYLDRSPVVAGRGNKAMVAWIANEASDLLGSATKPNQIRFASYDGTAWSQAADIGVHAGAITGMGLDYDGANATLVFAADVDGDTGTSEDQELFAATWDGAIWSSIVRLTNDQLRDSSPVLARDQSDSLKLVWYRDEAFMMSAGINPANGVAIVLPGLSAGAVDFRLTAGAGGQLFLTWPDSSATGQDIFAAGYDPNLNLWSKPRQLTETAAMERSLGAALDGNGTLHLVYNRVQINNEIKTVTGANGPVAVTVPAPGRVDLVHQGADFTGDLALQPKTLTITPAVPAPGDTVRIEATVVNKGLGPVANVAVAFYYGDPAAGGTLLGTETLAGPLVGGETAVVSLSDWQSPAIPFSGLDLYAVVDPEQTFVDKERGNNALRLPVFQADIVMDSLSWQLAGPDIRLVTARVKNQGSVAAADVKVAFARDADNSQPLHQETIAELAVGQQVDVVYEWDVRNETARQGVLPLYAKADPERTIPEGNYLNNSRMLMATARQPSQPGLPSVTDGMTGVALRPALAWQEVAEAAYYDLYLWPAAEMRPEVPFASRLTEITFAPDKPLAELSAYRWQVVAKNDAGSAAGPVWGFVTKSFLDGDVNNDGTVTLADAVFALKMLVDAAGAVPPEFVRADINQDGRIGLAETIHILRSIAAQ